MPTVADWQTAWKMMRIAASNARATFNFASQNSINYDQIEEDLRDNMRGSYRAQLDQLVTQQRATLAGLTAPPVAVMGLCLQTLRDVVGSTARTPREMVDDIRDVNLALLD